MPRATPRARSTRRLQRHEELAVTVVLERTRTPSPAQRARRRAGNRADQLFLLPAVVGANVWRWLLDGSYGLLNATLRGLGLIEGDVFWLGQPGPALVSVIVATAWSFAPFAMILLVAGLQGVPAMLYEAARIDGANAWQQFRYVTLPALRPVSVTVMLLIFIFAFKTFDTIYLMTRGGPGGSTLTLPLYAFQEAFEFRRYDMAAVATTVMLLVPLGLSVFYFRSLRR